MKLYSINCITKIVIVAAIVIGLTVVADPANADQVKISDGNTGWVFDSGGYFSRWVSRYVGRGLLDVRAVLSGSEFFYTHSDHHIKGVGMVLDKFSYNSYTGYISMHFRGQYYDKNYDDDYRWRASYMILSR